MRGSQGEAPFVAVLSCSTILNDSIFKRTFQMYFIDLVLLSRGSVCYTDTSKRTIQPHLRSFNEALIPLFLSLSNHSVSEWLAVEFHLVTG